MRLNQKAVAESAGASVAFAQTESFTHSFPNGIEMQSQSNIGSTIAGAGILSVCWLTFNKMITGGKMKKVLIALMLSIVCTVNVFSTPSTQIWIPSTDIQAFMKPHLGWDIYTNAFGDGLTSNGGLTMGVLPFKKLNLEVGIDYRDIGGVHGNPVYFNAKLGMPEDTNYIFMPALAIGGFDFGTKKDVTNYDVTYALAAKTIWVLGRFSVGGYKGFGPDGLWTSSESKVVNKGVLVSWDRTMSEISDKLWLAVDYQSGKNWYGALSFGAAWNFNSNIGLILGYDIWNDKDLVGKPTFTMQVDINVL